MYCLLNQILHFLFQALLSQTLEQGAERNEDLPTVAPPNAVASSTGTAGTAMSTPAAPTATAGASGSSSVASAPQVNRNILSLAQRYCGECKVAFDELSKIIQVLIILFYYTECNVCNFSLMYCGTSLLQKVVAFRQELVAYDRQQFQKQSHSDAKNLEEDPRSFVKQGKCYGCASAATEHCITLLRALASQSKYRSLLCENHFGLLPEMLDHNLKKGTMKVRRRH